MVSEGDSSPRLAPRDGQRCPQDSQTRTGFASAIVVPSNNGKGGSAGSVPMVGEGSGGAPIGGMLGAGGMATMMGMPESEM